MNDTDIRFVFLVRGLGAQESLVFTTYLSVDESGPDLYAATMAGMDGRIVAMGDTEEEACKESIELFKGMVDHALEQQQPIDRVVGNVPYRKVPVPVAKAQELFKLVTDALDRITEQEDDWRAFPMPSMRLEEATA